MPKKIDLYWFMPAFVKRSVGSDSGTTEDEGNYGSRSVEGRPMLVVAAHQTCDLCS